jgi:adenosylhomocysteine nucleosidase
MPPDRQGRRSNVPWRGSGRMATAEPSRRTWLLVAAERREFDGLLKRLGKPGKLGWPVDFGCEVSGNGDRWLLVANGPGTGLVEKALNKRVEVDGLISTGFCGALDPSLRVGDIILGGASVSRRAGQRSVTVRGEVVTLDRVAITAGEKGVLRAKTGAVAVDMEAAAVGRKAAQWGVPFYCIRAVSDTAFEDLPLDFNRYRDAQGRFSRPRIALAALARPFQTVPGLLRLDRNCKLAAEALGEFLVDCRF